MGMGFFVIPRIAKGAALELASKEFDTGSRAEEQSPAKRGGRHFGGKSRAAKGTPKLPDLQLGVLPRRHINHRREGVLPERKIFLAKRGETLTYPYG